MTNKTMTIALLVFFSTSISAQKTIFWEVTDTVNNKRSYILGTCHIVGASFIDSFDVVVNALKNSSLAIFEVLDEDKADNYIIQHRQKSDSVKMVLTKKEYNQLKSMNPAWNDDFLQKLKPFELKIKLVMRVSMQVCGNYSKRDSMIYLDDYLEFKSKKYGIKTVGLESGSEQIEVLGMMQDKTWASERRHIKALLEISKDGEYYPNLCDGDKLYIDFALPYDFDQPCPDDPLLKVRNEKWMSRLISHLSSENCFVAVGQGHLAYDCGLIVKLRENGFVVTPVMLK